MYSWLYRFCLAPALALTFTAPVQALSSDRQKPMYVEADHADINDKTGVHVYTGNVAIDQGTLHMTSDRLTLHTRDGEIVKAVALGEPATYRQRPDNKDQDVHAEALRMEYYADDGRIVLINAARVTQAGDVFSSEKIVYDINRDVVNAGSGGDKDRVRITIQPKNPK